MKLLNLHRFEYLFLGLSAVVAVALTVWFPFRSYFLVEANVEQIEVVTGSSDQLSWQLPHYELHREAGEPAEAAGSFKILPGSHVLIRRISRGPLIVSLLEPSGAQFTPKGSQQMVTVSADWFPATVVIPPAAFAEENLVLPLNATIIVGRSTDYVQSSPERPVIHSGTVEIQARAIDGRTVVGTTDQKLFMADALEFTSARNGNGVLHLSEEPGMALFYSTNARQALIHRYGASQPIVVTTSFLRRVTTDPVLGLIWAGFLFITGAMFFRRSMLADK